MMKDPTDQVFWKAYPEIKSDMMRSAVKAAQEVKCSL